MARVGNVPVVSAYKGNIGQQMMRVGERLDNISEDYERKQKKELAEAKELYTQGLNINLYEGINELRNNPELSSNPQGLSAEMDKVLEKTLSDVDDDDVKMAVMVDYQLKKGTYINHAQTEFNRIQREKARSYAFDTVYANIDSMGLSFANALVGNYTDDDVVNFQHSLANIEANINAKDIDGTYLFTDAQRKAMKDDARGSYLRGFKEIFEQLDEKQQRDIEEALNNNSFNIAQISNKQNPEEKKDINIEDVVGESSYKDIKNYVKKYNRAVIAEKIKERKYRGLLAVEDFKENPSKATYDKLVELNPEMPEKTMDLYREIYEATPDYEATTIFNSAKEAKNGIVDFTSITEGTQEDNAVILDNLAKYVSKLQRSNTDGNLSQDDVEKFSNLAYRAVNDKVFAAQINRIFGEDSAFDKALRWVLPQGTMHKVEQIGGQTISAVVDRLLKNDPEGAQEVYKEGQKRAIQIRYPEIPFSKLKEGDIFWYGPTSQAFKFLGYGVDDVIVEVDPQTGAVK